MLIIRLEHGDLITFSDSTGKKLGTIHRKDGSDLAFDFLSEIKITRQKNLSSRMTQNETQKRS